MSSDPFGADAVVLASGEDHGAEWQLVRSGTGVFLRLPGWRQAQGPWEEGDAARQAMFRHGRSTWRCWWGRFEGARSASLEGRPERAAATAGDWLSLPVSLGEAGMRLVVALADGRSMVVPAPPVIDDGDAVVLGDGDGWILRAWTGPFGGTVAEVCAPGFEGFGSAVELSREDDAPLRVAAVDARFAIGSARPGTSIEVDGASAPTYPLPGGDRVVWLAFGARAGAVVVARDGDGAEVGRAVVE